MSAPSFTVAPMQYTPSQRPAPRTPGPLIWIVGLIAAAALIVGIINFAEQQSSPHAEPGNQAPTNVANEASPSAAKNHICATFGQVAESVKTATSAPDGAEPIAASVNARAAITAGALALSRALSPAAPPAVSSAANRLLDAYEHYLLVAFQEKPQSDADRGVVGDASAALRGACA